MSSLKLLLAEIRYRRTNFALSLFAVTVATTLFVAGPVLVEGYGRQTHEHVAAAQQQTDTELRIMHQQAQAELEKMQEESAEELRAMEDETRKLMITMGFNLAIVHQDTDMSDFWAADFSTVDMPQEYVDRLASARELTLVEHLVAMLQQKIEWQDRKVLLVGYLPETPKPFKQPKKPMGYNIPQGSVYLGHELGAGRQEGETVDVLGKEFKIGKILPEQGSKEDISIGMHLTDAQEVLNKTGRINQIMALGCRCDGERLPKIRAQLAEVLPETKITEFRSIALARAEQRDMVAARKAIMLAQFASDKQALLEEMVAKKQKIVADESASRANIQRLMEMLAAVTTPLVVLICAIWVGLLALSNVRERLPEIGLLRALGKGSGKIASLFLGKATLLGLLGGALGYGLGTVVAQMLGTLALDVEPEYFSAAYDVLWKSLLGAPLVCVLASYLPILSAIVQDPAVVLRDA